MSFNKTIIIGHLTRDPELRYTPKGTAACKITVAVNRKWKDEHGDQKEEVSFVDCTAFGRTAENLSQYQRKGSQLLVEGRLKQETWEDKQTGQKRSALRVVVETVQFLGTPKRTEGDDALVPGPAPRPAPEAPASSPAPADPYADDDIPF